mmetsp:Transcript_9126/g.22386  ORF Transcript_9126/g.22386 Transcript_9126/m.22386 type:complete len:242 (+) Transcript_9126:706-1431(+)
MALTPACSRRKSETRAPSSGASRSTATTRWGMWTPARPTSSHRSRARSQRCTGREILSRSWPSTAGSRTTSYGSLSRRGPRLKWCLSTIRSPTQKSSSGPTASSSPTGRAIRQCVQKPSKTFKRYSHFKATTSNRSSGYVLGTSCSRSPPGPSLRSFPSETVDKTNPCGTTSTATSTSPRRTTATWSATRRCPRDGRLYLRTRTTAPTKGSSTPRSHSSRRSFTLRPVEDPRTPSSSLTCS